MCRIQLLKTWIFYELTNNTRNFAASCKLIKIVGCKSATERFSILNEMLMNSLVAIDRNNLKLKITIKKF